MTLNAANRATLRMIFADPMRGDVRWDDFVRLVNALGGEWLKPGHAAGSRRKAKLNGRKGLFHSPHPGALMKKGSVESAAEFLRNAGVTLAPEDERC